MAGFTFEQVFDEFEKYRNNVTEDDISGILDKEEKILRKANGLLDKFAKNLKLLFSVIKDYSAGKYTEIPWKTIAAITGTLIYIFCPVDLIPDFIPVAGMLDDAAVLALCLKSIGDDLNAYEIWKNQQADYRIVSS